MHSGIAGIGQFNRQDRIFIRFSQDAIRREVLPDTDAWQVGQRRAGGIIIGHTNEGGNCTGSMVLTRLPFTNGRIQRDRTAPPSCQITATVNEALSISANLYFTTTGAGINISRQCDLHP